jgi:RNA polymerase I-specific transcription initiation factor RRN6
LLIIIVSVLISSGKSALVNFYTFSISSDGAGAGAPTSSQGSFSLSTSLGDQGLDHEILHSLCFLRAPLTWSPSRIPGPEWKFVERDVKFYQVWALTSNLGLSSTLCATYTISARSTSLPRLYIAAPTTRGSFRRRPIEARHAVPDTFLVPDGLVDEEEFGNLTANLSQSDQRFWGKDKAKDDPKLRINWRGIFRKVFMDSLDCQTDAGFSESFDSMTKLVEKVSHRIQQNMEEDRPAMSSL